VRIAKGKVNFQNPEEFLICQGKIVRNRKVEDRKKPWRITNTFRWKDWSAYQKKKQDILCHTAVQLWSLQKAKPNSLGLTYHIISHK
jgi:hypothetical protein